jgi:hypothetical protein
MLVIDENEAARWRLLCSGASVGIVNDIVAINGARTAILYKELFRKIRPKKESATVIRMTTYLVRGSLLYLISSFFEKFFRKRKGPLLYESTASIFDLIRPDVSPYRVSSYPIWNEKPQTRTPKTTSKMNHGHNNQRTIPLSQEFTDGHFTVHLDTFCVTIDTSAQGWLPIGKYVRRCYNGGGLSEIIYSVEAVARSLMAHDYANSATDPLVSNMAAQYYSLYYLTDSGCTIQQMEKMFSDKTYHARGKVPCGTRGTDCHNPFHRMLLPPRVHFRRRYSKFIHAVERRADLLNDSCAHRVLKMRPEVVAKCKDQFHEEMCNAADNV